MSLRIAVVVPSLSGGGAEFAFPTHGTFETKVARRARNG